MNGFEDSDGFTLIETLIAFSLLALTIGIGFQTTNINLKGHSSVGSNIKMIELAEQEIALLKASLRPLDKQYSKEVDGYSLQTVISADTRSINEPNTDALYRVTIAISSSNRPFTQTWHTTIKRSAR